MEAEEEHDDIDNACMMRPDALLEASDPPYTPLILPLPNLIITYPKSSQLLR